MTTARFSYLAAAVAVIGLAYASTRRWRSSRRPAAGADARVAEHS